MQLEWLMRRVIRVGGIGLVVADRPPVVIGTPQIDGLTVRVHDLRTERRILFDPSLAFGEAYMDGTLTVEGGDIRDVLDVLCRNIGTGRVGGLRRLTTIGLRFSKWIAQYNPLSRARRNVAHHYDLSGELYDLFLDADRQYSCAYFARPDMTLDQAQLAKKRHIAAKLLLRPGLRVLDIGCGWGGMALTLAQDYDVTVTGITLSQEQQAFATERARRAGLEGRVRFCLRDYREVSDRYDRIVSVGMFEHVGTPHYADFFATCARLLADDGVMLLHAIGRMDGPGTTNPWLRKYIFPGGYSPAISEVIPHIERTGLWLTDVEILRLHYARTLGCWYDRFQRNRKAAAHLYDERFCRMWEFYLAACEVSFRHMGQYVWQAQLARQVDSVPITRDYLTDDRVRQDRVPVRVA